MRARSAVLHRPGHPSWGGGTPPTESPGIPERFSIILPMDLESLPGGTAVVRGLDDIAAGTLTNDALMVMIGAPRLRTLGLTVATDRSSNPETELYEQLAASDPDTAHSRYNALIRLLTSFERALQSAGR